jgi:hypothetical protein
MIFFIFHPEKASLRIKNEKGNYNTHFAATVSLENCQDMVMTFYLASIHVESLVRVPW